MHLFKYNTHIYRNKHLNHEQIIDEYLHGWCYQFQEILLKNLIGGEKYEIFDKTYETNGEFWNDHQVIKYKNYYIDIRGIFTEDELLQTHKNEYIKTCKKYGNSHTFIESYLKKVENETSELNEELLNLTTDIINHVLKDINIFFHNLEL